MPNVNIIFPEPLLEHEIPQIKPDEQAHFQATVNRAVALGHGDDVESITIHLRERTKPRATADGVVYDEGGWLEHLIVIKRTGGRQMVVGAIQRKPGNDSEFHS